MFLRVYIYSLTRTSKRHIHARIVCSDYSYNMMYSTSIASHLLLLTLLADEHTSNATMFHSCHTLSSCLPEYQCIPVHTLHSVQPCPAPVVLLLTALVPWAWQTMKPSLQPFCICFPNSFHYYITCQYLSCCTGEFYPAAYCALLLTSGLQRLTKVATELSTNWCFTSVNCEHSSDFANFHHGDDVFSYLSFGLATFEEEHARRTRDRTTKDRIRKTRQL